MRYYYLYYYFYVDTGAFEIDQFLFPLSDHIVLLVLWPQMLSVSPYTYLTGHIRGDDENASASVPGAITRDIKRCSQSARKNSVRCFTPNIVENRELRSFQRLNVPIRNDSPEIRPFMRDTPESQSQKLIRFSALRLNRTSPA